MAAPKRSIARWVSEQMALLKEENLSEIESIFASYSICDFGFDPIDILRALLVSSRDGVGFMPMQELANILRSGLRIGFPVSRALTDHLDCHSGKLSIPGTYTCVVMRTGKFNDAKLSAGDPSERNSLVGVVHRVLVNAGESPTWLKREGIYTNFLGQGDCLEVSV